MLRLLFAIGAFVFLSACADPLRDMPRLSDVDLSDARPVAQALPTEAEVARESFFDAPPIASVDGLLNTPVTASPKRGFLGALRNALPVARTEVQANAQNAGPVVGAQSDDVVVVPEANPTEVSSLTLENPKRGGFLAGLRRTATVPAARKGIDAVEVAYGTVLPFGQVARVCEARRKPLGRKVESASAKGYKLYDSNPGIAGVRTYYITGFQDGCPRQLTAAHAVLGAPSFYELLHYGPTGKHLVTGETDRAYEQIKSRVCGARKGRPCGARMNTLERDTFFVNAYERLDDNTQWSEMLVHDGAVVAAALKTN